MSLFSNPTFKPEVFSPAGGGSWAQQQRAEATMTVAGAVNKTAILLAICIAAAAGTWAGIQQGLTAPMWPMLGGFIVGAILSLIMTFKPTTARFLALPYAVCEGVFIGAVSLVYAEMAKGTKYGGAAGTMIVANAAICTFTTLGVMLSLYKLNVIRATERFKSVMMIAGIAVGLFFLIKLGLSFFNLVPASLQTGPLAIAICVGVTIFAALLLIIDFDMVEQGAARGAPKHVEWYAGFATLSTLVFIYLQFLRLLSLLNRRD
jgi:uncharacterized YccA/Bax inhibitor family protein